MRYDGLLDMKNLDMIGRIDIAYANAFCAWRRLGDSKTRP